jgi:pimeloyl-ACP methyl ester carboxylesterase
VSTEASVTAPTVQHFDSGNIRCQGWLYEPDGDPPYACVVMAHGFGAAPDGPLGRVARRLAEAGLAAFAFDYRNFGSSSGTPRHLLGVNRQLEDWGSAIMFVRGLERVDPDRIGLWGSSFSGGQVIAVAAGDPAIRAAVAQVPYVDGYALARAAGLRHFLRLIPALVRDTLQTKLLQRPYVIEALGPPGQRAALSTRFPDLYEELNENTLAGWENRIAARSLLDVYRFRPIRIASEVNCPLLVVVTYQDRVAPARTAIRAAHDLPYVEMAMFSARHFDLYTGEVFERAVATEAKFLARHLLERSPARAPA